MKCWEGLAQQIRLSKSFKHIPVSSCFFLRLSGVAASGVYVAFCSAPPPTANAANGTATTASAAVGAATVAVFIHYPWSLQFPLVLQFGLLVYCCGYRAEAQQLRHELLLLKRRMQCEAAAQQAQHEADSAAARAAWESEKQKLLIKNRTLQTTVDQWATYTQLYGHRKGWSIKSCSNCCFYRSYSRCIRCTTGLLKQMQQSLQLLIVKSRQLDRDKQWLFHG